MGRLLVPCCPERALELPGRVSLLQINYCSVLVSSVADVLAQGGGPWSKPVWGAWDEGGHGHPLCSGWWEQLGGCRLCCVLCLPCLAWESQEALAGHGSSGWCGCPLMEPLPWPGPNVVHSDSRGSAWRGPYWTVLLSKQTGPSASRGLLS